MIKKILKFILSSLLIFYFHQSMAALSSPLIIKSRQLILVITPNWKSNTGILQRYQREKLNASWKSIGTPISISIGEKGMTYSKIEGDHKSPAGIFELKKTFGFQQTSKIKMPYILIHPYTFCVNDSKSIDYNRIITSSKQKEWGTAEPMHEIKLYRQGILIEYNTKPIVPHAGSCIFMHTWEGPNKSTDGCTAMSAANLEKLIYWLRPKRNPVLIQLPYSEHIRFKKVFQLPYRGTSLKLFFSKIIKIN